MKERKDNDEPAKITQAHVMGLGFTPSMIRKLLPEPELKRNPHYACAAPMKLWPLELVERVMESEEFRTLRAKADKRSATAKEAARIAKEKKIEAAIAAVKNEYEQKFAKFERYVENPHLSYESLDNLRELAIHHYKLIQQQRQYEREILFGDYDSDPYWKDAENADEATMQRWEVNFLRHCCSSYDKYLEYGAWLSNIDGNFSRYRRLKSAILRKIAEIYPHLQQECSRQILGMSIGP